VVCRVARLRAIAQPGEPGVSVRPGKVKLLAGHLVLDCMRSRILLLITLAGLAGCSGGDYGGGYGGYPSYGGGYGYRPYGYGGGYAGYGMKHSPPMRSPQSG
jgi:hypothetical protein